MIIFERTKQVIYDLTRPMGICLSIVMCLSHDYVCTHCKIFFKFGQLVNNVYLKIPIDFEVNPKEKNGFNGKG